MKDEVEEKDTNALLLKVYLNLAVCCVKTKHSSRAIAYCKRSLDIDRKNAKAMYLMGKVSVTLRVANKKKKKKSCLKQLLKTVQ